MSKAPVSRNPAVVTARILDAAEAEFARAGFEGASTNAICAGFGGSKATLFRYFPTKEQMLEAVVARIASDWREAISHREIAATDPAGWLTGFAVQTLTWILSERLLFVGRLGVGEGRRLPRLQPVFTELASEPLRDLVAQRLADWSREGHLQVDDPQGCAVHYLDLVVAGPVSRALYGVERLEGEALRRHAASAVALFLSGVRPRSPR